MTNELDNLEEGTDQEVDTPETPQALLAGKFKTQEDLIKGTEELYKKLEQKLGAVGNQATGLDMEQLKAAGFMTRGEFEQQQALSTFLSANPDARTKLPALQALQGSEAYKDKTLDQIYSEVFAGNTTPVEKDRIIRETIIGEQPTTSRPLTSLTPAEIDKLSDEEFAKAFETNGQAPSLKRKS